MRWVDGFGGGYGSAEVGMYLSSGARPGLTLRICILYAVLGIGRGLWPKGGLGVV